MRSPWNNSRYVIRYTQCFIWPVLASDNKLLYLSTLRYITVGVLRLYWQVNSDQLRNRLSKWVLWSVFVRDKIICQLFDLWKKSMFMWSWNTCEKIHVNTELKYLWKNLYRSYQQQNILLCQCLTLYIRFRIYTIKILFFKHFLSPIATSYNSFVVNLWIIINCMVINSSCIILYYSTRLLYEKALYITKPKNFRWYFKIQIIRNLWWFILYKHNFVCLSLSFIRDTKKMFIIVVKRTIWHKDF